MWKRFECAGNEIISTILADVSQVQRAGLRVATGSLPN